MDMGYGQVRTWVKAIQVQSSTLLSFFPPSLPRPPILPLTRAMHLSLVAVPPGCSQSQLCVKMKKESYSFTVYRAVGRSQNPVGHDLPYAWLEEG